MTFKRKLFLSFLLLAFLPTAALIFFSYYLATEGSCFLAARGVSEALAAGDSLAMWAVQQEQQRLTTDLQQWMTMSAVELQELVGRDSLPALAIMKSGDSIAVYHNLDEADFQVIYEQLENAATGSDRGRLVIGECLFLWQRLDSAKTSLMGGRFLPEEYFRLANRLIEGKVNYQGLSKTLLPIGRELLLKIAIALMAISLILSLLAAQMLSYSMSSPLDKLVDATKRISGGDLKHRLATGREDEIGTVIVNFNQMTEKLQTTTQNLLAAEREMAWKETARTIAHEIKNLLTPVNIALFKIKQKIADGQVPDADLGRSVAALAVEVDAIAELARQFALFAHPTKVAPSPVDIRKLIGEVTSFHADAAANHKLDVSVAEDVDQLRADPDLLRRALSNLVKNSLEATPYGGEISISVRRETGDIILEVADDGPGADEAIDLALPYVTTKKSGTGLGLAIVKKVCEAHGWELTYGNKKPGFVVTIGIPADDK